MITLGVNIDHVATIRQARQTYEPDPVTAASEAELGGADAITIHLREDRRHINDRDVQILRQTVHTKLNLEMSLVDEIVEIACKVVPDQATLVPERRQEVTTEGGLDIIEHGDRTKIVVEKLCAKGIETSAFLDPDIDQINQAADLGFNAVELHTGSYANATGDDVSRELDRLTQASARIVALGLHLHAGHGLNYINTPPVAAIPQMYELNIGHSIISRAVFVGLRQAVAQMKALIQSSN